MARKEVEFDFDTFIASIDNWDGQNPPFEEVMRSAIMHAALMHRHVAFIRGLREKLEIAGSTISRYATGVARPMDNVMKMVVREARAILTALRVQSVREHNAAILAARHSGICSGDDED